MHGMASSAHATLGAVQKNRACIPCHEHKVRCDVTQSGSPCTRCVKHARTASCQLVPLPDRSARRRKKVQRRPGTGPAEQTQHEQTQHDALGAESIAAGQAGAEVPRQAVGGCFDMSEQSPVALLDSARAESLAVDASTSSQTRTTHLFQVRESARGTETQAQSQAPGTATEEDVELETCLRMGEPGNELYNLISEASSTRRNRDVYAYYGGVGATTILGQLFSSKPRREFVQIRVPKSQNHCGEASNLHARTREHLKDLGAFDLPPFHARQELIRLYFERPFPYIPVLNRLAFMQQFRQGTCSTFLLQCMFTSAAPYMNAGQLAECGYSDTAHAQKAFFTKAQMLHDGGQEQSQVSLLQGSVMLTSVYIEFGDDRDCRFWLSNAVRIATQMGLHRRHIVDQFEPNSRKVCIRIFWTVFSRDMIIAMAGRVNTRILDERYCDLAEPSVDDWEEDSEAQLAFYDLSPITVAQRSYLVYSSRLARICAQYHELFRRVDISPTEIACNRIENDYLDWKRSLPPHLQVDNVDEFSHRNILILVLKAMAFRLECLLYRDMQRSIGRWQNGMGCSRALRKQQDAMLGFDAIVNRLLLHDLVQFCPFSMTTCASTILAMHIECVLSTGLTDIQRQVSQTGIRNGLTYLRASLRHWKSLKWSLRMFDAVVSKFNLLSDGSEGNTIDFLAADKLRQEIASKNEAQSQWHAVNRGAVSSHEKGEQAWSSMLYPSSFSNPATLIESTISRGAMEGDADSMDFESLFGGIAVWAGVDQGM